VGVQVEYVRPKLANLFAEQPRTVEMPTPEMLRCALAFAREGYRQGLLLNRTEPPLKNSLHHHL